MSGSKWNQQQDQLTALLESSFLDFGFLSLNQERILYLGAAQRILNMALRCLAECLSQQKPGVVWWTGTVLVETVAAGVTVAMAAVQWRRGWW